MLQVYVKYTGAVVDSLIVQEMETLRLFVTLIIAVGPTSCCLLIQDGSKEFEVQQFACYVRLRDVENRNDHGV